MMKQPGEDSAYNGALFKQGATSKGAGDEEAAKGPTLQPSLSGKVLTPTAVGHGTWYHAGAHLATTIAVPAAILPLPSALALLGWPAGLIALCMGIGVTYYTSLLLASLADYKGVRHIRYRELADSILGRKGFWAVTFFQQVASWGNNITIQIVAGASLKAIYKTYNPDGNMTLQQFIIIFGAAELVISQLADIHSLRFVNMTCMMSTWAFSIIAIAMSIKNGTQDVDRSTVSYDVGGNTINKLMGIFSALGIIAFAFGDAMLPEIQATVREPNKRNMYKAISLAYTVIGCTYLMVAIVGYWAFGATVNIYLLNQLGPPSWPVTVANAFAIWQILGCYQIYCRPTYEVIDLKIQDTTRPPYCLRNVVCRLATTSVYVAIATTIAAMIPFFGDFVALFGAIGFTPLDFVIPVVLHTVARKPSRMRATLNWSLALLYSVIAILGSVGAIRFIILHAQAYSVFADLF